MAKDFLTYNQQMKYLRGDKLIACNGSKEKSMLISNGYFNLVNGYKNPFVIRTENGKHIYHRGTRIQELFALKEFDDNLRMLLLKYITKVEEEIRSLVAYSFDYCNDRGKTPWYSIDAFDTSQNATKLVKVISDAYSEINRSKQEYVKYYLEHHNIIPTWILVKTINFSTLIDLIKYSKPHVKNSLCALYNVVDNNNRNDHKLLIGSLHWFRTIRNSCAHNERIYTMCRQGCRLSTPYWGLMSGAYSRDRDEKIVDAIVFMKYYLPHRIFEKMIKEFRNALNDLSSEININAFERVRVDLGIKKINHFDEILKNPQTIDYNKFSIDI